MFCTNCGALIGDGNKFCSNCGFNLVENSKSTSDDDELKGGTYVVNSNVNGMSFSESISICLSKYIVFEGRASRSEFWWFILFGTLISWGALLIDQSKITNLIVNLALLLPTLSVGSRRLHDINKSGYFQLIAFTGIGLIFLVIWFSAKGDKGKNTFDANLTDEEKKLFAEQKNKGFDYTYLILFSSLASFLFVVIFVLYHNKFSGRVSASQKTDFEIIKKNNLFASKPKIQQEKLDRWNVGIFYKYYDDGSCVSSIEERCVSSSEYKELCSVAKGMTVRSLKLRAVNANFEEKSLLGGGQLERVRIFQGQTYSGKEKCFAVVTMSGMVNGTSTRKDIEGTVTSFIKNEEGNILVSHYNNY